MGSKKEVNIKKRTPPKHIFSKMLQLKVKCTRMKIHDVPFFLFFCQTWKHFLDSLKQLVNKNVRKRKVVRAVTFVNLRIVIYQ